MRPTKWHPSRIRNFMILFGAESSIFDLATFGMLVYVFKANASVSQSAWFIESVVSAILILMIIRSPRPVFKSSPSKSLLVIGFSLIAVVFYLPFSPVADSLGMVSLSWQILQTVIVIVVVYCLTSEVTKLFFFKRINAMELS